MSVPDLFAQELLDRELAEQPPARAARLAHQRWVTQLRLWAAMDREGVTEPGDQAQFIGSRLWPDLGPELMAQFVDAVRTNTARGAPLNRPTKASDVVGERLEQLMREHGYEILPR